MSTKSMPADNSNPDIKEMRRNARRNAVWLGFVAFGFFLAFIAMSFVRG